MDADDGMLDILCREYGGTELKRNDERLELCSCTFDILGAYRVNEAIVATG